MSKRFRSRRQWDAAIVLLMLVFSVGFFSPCLFGGRVFAALDELAKYYPWKSQAPPGFESHNSLIADSAIQFLPWRIFVEKTLESGEVPLWNPHQLAGQPFAANAQSAVFYPVSAIVMALCEPSYGIGVEACLHLFFAGLFAFLWLRGMKFSRGACATAGFAFMLSGWFVGWMAIPSFFKSAVWFPLMALFYELGRKGAAGAGIAGGSVALAFAFLAGQFQLAAYQAVALAGYALGRWFFSKGGERTAGSLFRGMALVAAIGLAGIALASAQILPSLALTRISARHEIQPGLWGIFFPGMHPASLMRLLAPDFFGNPAKGAVWARSNYSEYSMYLGIVPLLLALFSWPDRRGRVGLLLMAGALLMAMGSPLYAPVYYLIPGMKKVTVHRAVVLFSLVSPLAVAAGWDRLFHGSRPSGRSLCFIGAMLAAVHFVLWLWIKNETALSAGRIWTLTWVATVKFSLLAAAAIAMVHFSKRFPRVGAAALCVLLAADLLPFAWVYNTMASKKWFFPPSNIQSFLEREREPFRIHTDARDPILWYALPMALNLSTVEGYESLYPKRYGDFLRAIDLANGLRGKGGTTPKLWSLNSPAVDMMNVRYVLTRSGPPGEGYVPVFQGEADVYRNLRAAPRAFLSGRWRLAPEKEILDAVTSPRFDWKEVWLERGAGTEAPLEQGGAGEGGRILSMAATPTSLTFEVEAPMRMALFVSDAWNEGWKCAVNGKIETIFRANYAFKSVFVPPGKSRVTMSFRPLECTLGSAAGLALAVVFFAVLADRLRKRPGPASV